VINKTIEQILTTKPVLQNILKGIIHSKEEDKCNHGNVGKNKSHQMSRQKNEK
jgi:hypothetical protein